MLTPVIVPSIITAIAMYYLFGKLGLIGNFLWLGLCHAAIAMLVVLLILLSALHAVDPNLERAALGLAADRVRVFCRVVLPIVLSAALFAFLASFDELLISLFLAGCTPRPCRCGFGTASTCRSNRRSPRSALS